eukprot:752990-Hanusia_phi.AAC.7
MQLGWVPSFTPPFKGKNWGSSETKGGGWSDRKLRVVSSFLVNCHERSSVDDGGRREGTQGWGWQGKLEGMALEGGGDG